MKICSLFIVLLTLTALLLTGCGCSNIPPMPETRPATAPATAPNTQPATRPAQRPTLAPTGPTIEDGNGPAPTTTRPAPAKR